MIQNLCNLRNLWFQMFFIGLRLLPRWMFNSIIPSWSRHPAFQYPRRQSEEYERKEQKNRQTFYRTKYFWLMAKRDFYAINAVSEGHEVS